MSLLHFVEVPPIAPDFSAPFQVGLQIVVSYLLGAAMIVVLGALIFAVGSLALAGVAPERMNAWAGKSIVTILIAAVILGSVSGLFQFAVNFQFGF